MKSHRPHVFSLTPDQQVAVELWEQHRWMGIKRFCIQVGIHKEWFYKALEKHREIAALETPPSPRPSSLSRARGNIRMAGTR